MISAIKTNGRSAQLSLNVFVSEVKSGFVVYEPCSELIAFGEHPYEAKDILRGKIKDLYADNFQSFESLFTQSKADENLKLSFITLEKAVAKSGLMPTNIDVTTLNLTVCKQEDITQTSLVCL